MRFTRYLRNVQNVLIKAESGRKYLSTFIFHVSTNTYCTGPTGITGLYHHPNPRPALVAVYSATLKELESTFPKDSVYRQSVENMTKARLAVVESTEVTEVIENKIGCGLIEEILVQAGEEYDLVKKMAEWKPWEELEEKPLDDQWTYFERE